MLVVPINLAALILPAFRGSAGRSKHLWICRLKNVGTHRHPYIVPNGRVFASFFAIVTCTSTFATSSLASDQQLTSERRPVLAVNSLGTLYSPGGVNQSWTMVPLIPYYWVLWMSCFDALFAIWVSPVTRAATWTDRFKHPWFLNSLCWIPPFALTITGAIFSAQLWKGYDNLRAAEGSLVAALEVADQAFQTKGLAGVNLPGLVQLGNNFKYVHSHLGASSER